MLVLGVDPDHRAHGAIGEEHASVGIEQHQRIGQTFEHFACQWRQADARSLACGI